MRRFVKWLFSVPHLFGKVMVVWCVACGSAFSFYSLRIVSRTDNNPASTLIAILGFFGGELGFMFARDSLKGKNKEAPEDWGGKEEKL